MKNEVVQAEVTVHDALVDNSGARILRGDVGMEPGGEGEHGRVWRQAPLSYRSLILAGPPVDLWHEVGEMEGGQVGMNKFWRQVLDMPAVSKWASLRVPPVSCNSSLDGRSCLTPLLPRSHDAELPARPPWHRTKQPARPHSRPVG